MGYIRKALSITTLGLSNLVLDDDSKPAAGTTKARPRPRKRPGSKAATKATKTSARARRARTKPGAARPAGEHKTSPPKSRSARAKPKATAAKRGSTTSTARAKPRARAAGPQPQAEAKPKAEAAPPPIVARPGAPTSGVAIALDRIAKLHMNGALTDREFAAAKARILGTSAPPDQPEEGSAAFPAIEANVAAARRLAGYSHPGREPSAPAPGASRGI